MHKYIFVFEYRDTHVHDYLTLSVDDIELFPESSVSIDFPNDSNDQDKMKTYNMVLDDCKSILHELPSGIIEIAYAGIGPYIVRIRHHDIFKVDNLVQGYTYLNPYKIAINHSDKIATD